MSGIRWLVEVDRDSCGGTGLCVGRSPEHFELDAGRRSRVREAIVDPAEAVSDAAECCPMEAIRVSDAATGRLLYPQD